MYVSREHIVLAEEYSSQLPVQLGLLAPSKRKPCSETGQPSMNLSAVGYPIPVANCYYFEIMLKITNILYVLSYMSSIFNFCHLIDEECVTHGV